MLTEAPAMQFPWGDDRLVKQRQRGIPTGRRQTLFRGSREYTIFGLTCTKGSKLPNQCYATRNQILALIFGKEWHRIAKYFEFYDEAVYSHTYLEGNSHHCKKSSVHLVFS